MEQENNKIILEDNRKDLSEYVKVYDDVIPAQKLQKLMTWLEIVQKDYWEAGKEWSNPC